MERQLLEEKLSLCMGTQDNNYVFTVLTVEMETLIDIDFQLLPVVCWQIEPKLLTVN